MESDPCVCVSICVFDCLCIRAIAAELFNIGTQKVVWGCIWTIFWMYLRAKVFIQITPLFEF